MDGWINGRMVEWGERVDGLIVRRVNGLPDECMAEWNMGKRGI